MQDSLDTTPRPGARLDPRQVAALHSAALANLSLEAFTWRQHALFSDAAGLLEEGGGRRAPRVREEAEGSVLGARDEVEVAVPVEVAEGRFRIRSDVHAEERIRGPGPLGEGRRGAIARVLEELKRAIGLAGDEVDVTVVIEVAERRRGLLRGEITGGRRAEGLPRGSPCWPGLDLRQARSQRRLFPRRCESGTGAGERGLRWHRYGIATA